MLPLKVPGLCFISLRTQSKMYTSPPEPVSSCQWPYAGGRGGGCWNQNVSHLYPPPRPPHRHLPTRRCLKIIFVWLHRIQRKSRHHQCKTHQMSKQMWRREAVWMRGHWNTTDYYETNQHSDCIQRAAVRPQIRSTSMTRKREKYVTQHSRRFISGCRHWSDYNNNFRPSV